MKCFIFSLMFMWLTACAQESEIRGKVHSLPQGLTGIRNVLAAKPKSPSAFLDEILLNNKLSNNFNKLDIKIEKYIKRGGDINATLDNYGNTMLNEALRAGKESFAIALIHSKASKTKALRALLTLKKPPSAQAWREVKWLIERDAPPRLLNVYVEELITGTRFNPESMRQAMKLGVNKQQALTTALQAKNTAALEVLVDFIGAQKVIDAVLQTNDYDTAKQLLTKLDKESIEIDADQLLVKALLEGDKEKENLAVIFGASKKKLTEKSLQERDYDVLDAIFEQETWQSLDQMMLLFHIFKTKDSKVIEMLLGKYDKEGRLPYLNHMLREFVGAEDYDTAEFIVEQGGDPNVIIAGYLDHYLNNNIFKKLSNPNFDLQRVQRMVAKGAEPNKDNKLDIFARRVMRDLYVDSVTAKQRDLLKFLLTYIDKKTINAMEESRALLHRLLDAQQQTGNIPKHILEASSVRKELIATRKSIITMLQEKGVSVTNQ